MAQTDPNVSDGSGQPSSLRTRRQRLEASLEVDIAECCPVSFFDGDITFIDVTPNGDTCVTEFVTDNMNDTCSDILDRGGACDCNDVEIEGADEAIVRASIATGSRCICETFWEYGCTPHVSAGDNDTIEVDSLLPDRETLRQIIEDLDEITSRVQVTRIQEIDPGGESGGSATIDLESLTEKQRHCLRLALDNGFFDNPREITQEELADELGISPSAVSRRLRSIQKRIFDQVKPDIQIE